MSMIFLIVRQSIYQRHLIGDGRGCSDLVALFSRCVR